MIVEALLSVGIGLWLGILSLLPSGDTEAFEESFEWESAHGLFEPIWMLDAWLPMTLMLTCIGILWSMRLAIFVYSTLHHIWKALPFT